MQTACRMPLYHRASLLACLRANVPTCCRSAAVRSFCRSAAAVPAEMLPSYGTARSGTQTHHAVRDPHKPPVSPRLSVAVAPLHGPLVHIESRHSAYRLQSYRVTGCEIESRQGVVRRSRKHSCSWVLRDMSSLGNPRLPRFGEHTSAAEGLEGTTI